jgi:hypothetical protein
MTQKHDDITQVIMTVERLKSENKYDEAVAFLEKNIVKYHDDYRIFEEL